MASENNLCECGCGEEVGPGKRFRPSHNLRGSKSPEHREKIKKSLAKYYEETSGGKKGKTCPYCGEFKEAHEFGFRNTVDSNGNNHIKSYCMKCEVKRRKDNNSWYTPERGRKHQLKYKYGLTEEEYGAMVSRQGGACAVCGVVPKKKLFVDHCHTTGDIRGLLCDQCNFAIGHMRDDPDRLRRAADYLESYHVGHVAKGERV